MNYTWHPTSYFSRYFYTSITCSCLFVTHYSTYHVISHLYIIISHPYNKTKILLLRTLPGHHMLVRYAYTAKLPIFLNRKTKKAVEPFGLKCCRLSRPVLTVRIGDNKVSQLTVGDVSGLKVLKSKFNRLSLVKLVTTNSTVAFVL